MCSYTAYDTSLLIELNDFNVPLQIVLCPAGQELCLLYVATFT